MIWSHSHPVLCAVWQSFTPGMCSQGDKGSSPLTPLLKLYFHVRKNKPPASLIFPDLYFRSSIPGRHHHEHPFPFYHTAPTHRVEALLQTQQTEKQKAEYPHPSSFVTQRFQPRKQKQGRPSDTLPTRSSTHRTGRNVILEQARQYQPTFCPGGEAN